MSHNELQQKILFEYAQLEKNFEIYNDLFVIADNREPNVIELAAMSAVINSFYMGIERIMEFIAKKIDNLIPQGDKWHKELLNQMLQNNEKRKAVISKEMFEMLAKFLSFRHFQRNSYEYILNWNELKPLFVSLKETLNKFKSEINHFID